MLAGHWLWLFSRWCTGLCSVRDGHRVQHVSVVLVSMTLALCPRPVIGECGASETIHAWALSGCGSADSAPCHTMPYHAVNVFSVPNGSFSRLQVVHPLSTIHSVTEDFFGISLVVSSIVVDYLHQFTSFWLCQFLVTFVSQVLKDLRGYEAGLRGWGGEVMARHVTRFQKGLNAKSEELGTCQVTGLQYAFEGSFFSDVNEAVQRCVAWLNHRKTAYMNCNWMILNEKMNENNMIPVVPHKAVAEGSKTGNL